MEKLKTESIVFLWEGRGEEEERKGEGRWWVRVG